MNRHTRNTLAARLVVAVLFLALAACSPTSPSTTAPATALATTAPSPAQTESPQLDPTPTISGLVLETAVPTAAPAGEPYPVPGIPSLEDLARLSETDLAGVAATTLRTALAEAAALQSAAETFVAAKALSAADITSLTTLAASLQASVEQAQGVASLYVEKYGSLAAASLPPIQTAQKTLAALAAQAAAASQLAAAAASTIDQGTFDQLQALADELAGQTAALQPVVEGWLAAHQADIEARVAQVAALQPTEIAADEQAALTMLSRFVSHGGEALADGTISETEFQQLAQEGVNVAAGLQAHGKPETQVLVEGVNTVLTQIASGNLPGLGEALTLLQFMLGPYPVP